MTGAKDGQPCRYCEEPAAISFVYGDKANEYVPCCEAHTEHALKELKLMARGTKDKVDVGDAVLPYSMEWRMRKAKEAAPTYPKPDENSRFGQRVSPRQAKSAVEALPQQISPTADGPPRVVSLQDMPDTFLKALATDWSNLRAWRGTNDRITITVDGQRYTMISRRG